MARQVSPQAEKKLAELKERYPAPQSAVMAALYIAQEEFGTLTDDALLWVAGRIGLPTVHVRELATSYSMYATAPRGKYHCQVCGTLSCAVTGSAALLRYLAERFGVPPRRPTADGMWSYEQVECLGSCGTGPVCQINDTFFESLTVEKLGALLDRIEREQPNLGLSMGLDILGEGMKGDGAL